MFPSDPAVDLAILSFPLRQDIYEYKEIPVDMLATEKTVTDLQIAEGDPVLFSGLSIQYFGKIQMEPIVRTGSIAMMPEEMIQTTLRKLGKVYLAEAHAFGGKWISHVCRRNLAKADSWKPGLPALGGSRRRSFRG